MVLNWTTWAESEVAVWPAMEQVDRQAAIERALRDVLEPRPFHGMTRYPYGPEESYPLTPARWAVMERYDTRVVAEPLPPLELRATAERGR